MSIGGQSLAILRDPTTKETSDWLKEGQRWGNYRVVKISIETDSVDLTEGETNYSSIKLVVARVLNAPITSVQTAPAKLLTIEEMDWDYIRSYDNPMRRKAPRVPSEIGYAWSKMTEGQKNEARNQYRKHGWDFRVHINEQGVVTGWETEPIFRPGEYEAMEKVPVNIKKFERKAPATQPK